MWDSVWNKNCRKDSLSQRLGIKYFRIVYIRRNLPFELTTEKISSELRRFRCENRLNDWLNKPRQKHLLTSTLSWLKQSHKWNESNYLVEVIFDEICHPEENTPIRNHYNFILNKQLLIEWWQPTGWFWSKQQQFQSDPKLRMMYHITRPQSGLGFCMDEHVLTNI